MNYVFIQHRDSMAIVLYVSYLIGDTRKQLDTDAVLDVTNVLILKWVNI